MERSTYEELVACLARAKARKKVAAIVGRYGLSLREVHESRSHEKHYAAARAALWLFFRDELGWSTLSIGRFFGRCHTSVVVATNERRAAEARVA